MKSDAPTLKYRTTIRKRTALAAIVACAIVSNTIVRADGNPYVVGNLAKQTLAANVGTAVQTGSLAQRSESNDTVQDSGLVQQASAVAENPAWSFVGKDTAVRRPSRLPSVSNVSSPVANSSDTKSAARPVRLGGTGLKSTSDATPVQAPLVEANLLLKPKSSVVAKQVSTQLNAANSVGVSIAENPSNVASEQLGSSTTAATSSHPWRPNEITASADATPRLSAQPTIASGKVPPIRIPEPAARRDSRSQARAPLPSVSASWLPSTTSSSSQQESLRLLSLAMQEYSRKAWASAEASAWESLRHTAEGIDIADRGASMGRHRGTAAATKDLRAARDAIRESRDFAGKYGDLDATAIERIVLSHSTTVLKNQSMQNVPSTDAIDRYLNEARMKLSRLAKFRPEAAQALDLIAAIYLGRGDSTTLPSQTSLCLRRAALQGQPGNASLASRLGMHLASVGLDNEAKWALEHSQSIDPTAQVAETLELVTQRAGDRAASIRVAARMRSRMPSGYEPQANDRPAVLQLTPREFASASRSVMSPKQAAGSASFASMSQSPQQTRPPQVATTASTAIRAMQPSGMSLPTSNMAAQSPPPQSPATQAPATQSPGMQRTAPRPAGLAAPVLNQPVLQQSGTAQAPGAVPSGRVPVAQYPNSTGFDDLLGSPSDFKVKPNKSAVKRMMDTINPWK